MTTTTSVRTTMPADRYGATRTIGASSRDLRGSSGTPTAGGFHRARRNPSEGAEQVRAQAGDAEDARADVRADDRADLGDQLRVAPEDLATALGQALGLALRLDVLDGEAVTAVLAPRLEVRDEPLEGARRSAHALDGLDLAFDREDRLDPQRGA